jgi:plasmid replication initiation protein
MAACADCVPSITISVVIDNDPPAIDPGEPPEYGFEMRSRAPQEQPALFSTEDLVIPEALRRMRKAVSAIHAVPAKAEHRTLNNLRLFDACILVAQLECRKRDGLIERVRAERVSPMFETRITDLVRLAGIPGKNYERVYEELDRLYELNLKWNIVAEAADVEFEMKSHFLSSVGYGRGRQRGVVRFSIEPSILEIVLEPSNWANLSLQAMAGLSSASSYALYQNAWRYVNTHAKVTAPLPTATWIELLVGQSRYVVDDPVQGKRVVNYGDFKRRILMDALRRVNELSALGYTLELKEHRSGTRITRLQFRFIPKKQASLGLPLTWPDDVLRVLASLGFSDNEIQDMSQAHSHEVVAETLLRMKAAEERLHAMGRAITSKKAYFSGILGNIASGAAAEDLDAEKIEAEAKAQEAQLAAQARQDRRQQEFARHQGDVFITRLFELPEAQRQALINEFEESPSGTKAQLLLAKGWTAKNIGALSLLRAWVASERRALFEQMLVNPQDRNFDAWMAWRLDTIEQAGDAS